MKICFLGGNEANYFVLSCLIEVSAWYAIWKNPSFYLYFVLLLFSVFLLWVHFRIDSVHSWFCWTLINGWVNHSFYVKTYWELLCNVYGTMHLPFPIFIVDAKWLRYGPQIDFNEITSGQKTGKLWGVPNMVVPITDLAKQREYFWKVKGKSDSC